MTRQDVLMTLAATGLHKRAAEGDPSFRNGFKELWGATKGALGRAGASTKDFFTNADNWKDIGIGAGTGLAVGGGAYLLGGLSPELRKRRLLRALIAAGAGIGAGTTAGIYGSDIRAGANKAYGYTRDKVKGAYGDIKAMAQGAGSAYRARHPKQEQPAAEQK